MTRQIIMKGRKPADEVRALYGQYLDEVIYMPIVDMNDSASDEYVKSETRIYQIAEPRVDIYRPEGRP